ncbi:DUF3892 domain-containing protein [Myroides odoratimimus]|uniref:DUF3892 domain-containing protein n=1 Tax=Myroides odoratimimus TaxID=76832 RepID=A0AAI8C924_9FLAO|nr:DUF3892 domain-containing protein [Myroides odoratimimus]ALU28165.1 hypothetical protein AS202_19335 [Myroides odoratimimus]MDM1038437.1 DUF3892 domain-containing protein [Myroides odoratimimus]MDM1052590.1 DUF3892 domain-containing protein [Myroides odoratimimus]MDM1066993.1 DUF3892 domain-containing protein [Myroides odoratimimus]MDM1460389.1 DUF3892 domain-containing protein [Myroides odoratimimus]
MSKSANYLISGVWKDSNDNITHVMLHLVNDGDSWSMGEKTSEANAIALLKKGNIIKTIVWGYPGWSIKSKVTYIQRAGKEYLRSEANTTTKDNLDNLISMKAIK